MATYKNARGALTTTLADIYTAPEGGAKITMIQVANIHATNAVDVTVVWTDASASNEETALCFASPLEAGDALSVQAGGLVLEEGDKLRARASADSNAVITVSLIEV